jgi:hypothetical protein
MQTLGISKREFLEYLARVRRVKKGKSKKR